MSETQVADLLQTRNRFLRSVHLERDFDDISALDGYILTSQTKSNLLRLISSISSDSSQRAWRITGDYGSGKSTFALALAHLLSGQYQSLPEQLRNAVDFQRPNILNQQLIPVLVTGSRDAVAVSVLKSLLHALKRIYDQRKLPQIIQHVESLIKLSAKTLVPDMAVMQLLQDANDYIYSTGKGTGILLILDELGKFLEFAALHPDRQDIYFLQNLAEAAVRSEKPSLIVVGFLHQGFNVYADQLSQVSQREWEKVTGRFEELLFNQPLEQTTTLIAEALNVLTDRLPRDLTERANSEMASALELGWYGSMDTRDSLLANALRIYPLHPTVLPVLVKLFSRFGQNERSLFSFILSNEPFGLKAFADRPIEIDSFYRIHHLYDYARATFGHRLNVQSYRSHWNQIESVVESFPATDKVELQVLKTVALLTLLDTNSLLASDTAIELAVAGEEPAKRKRVKDIIATLQKDKHVLYYRGAAGGYCLWPYTSVNLERAYDESLKALNVPQRVSSIIQDDLESRPLVARRHYIETGNLRCFEIRYAAVTELESFVGTESVYADGRILVPLCETEEERLEAMKFATLKALKNRKNLLVAIPKPLLSLRGLVQETKRWEWIAHNIPELNHDSYASEEVSRQIAASRQVLQNRIQGFVGLRQFTEKMELQWFHQNKHLSIDSGRELLSKLSSICDEIYSEAPNIRNELVNRRTLSSAAAAARMRLIERMFKYNSEPLLGMDPAKKPPEMSMYLSVLQNSALHQKTKDGYMIVEPNEQDDSCKLRPTLQRILELIKDRPDSRVCVSDLFNELKKPPYGVRDGLLPLLLAAFSIIHEHDVAFYEDGAFLRHISGEHLYRIIKAPESFEIQWCQISGIRSVLFNQLLSVLELNHDDNQDNNILDVVRPLCLFAAQLPAYTHKTKNISTHTLAVRQSLLSAHEPVVLLFRDLPMACGIEGFSSNDSPNAEDVERFVNTLKDTLDELKAAYPELIDKMKAAILSTFDLPGPFSKARATLARTADGMLVAVKEPQLKAFCLRLVDTNLPETQWLESLGSFVCSKPPSKWTDTDADLFCEELYHLARQFKRVEGVIFSKTKASQGTAVRVAITRRDGTEVEKVVFINPNEEALAAEIETAISALLLDTKRVGLAAASRAIWKELSKSNGKQNDQNGKIY